MCSATPIDPVLVRGRTTNALSAYLADTTHRHVAGVVGCDHTTVGRRGSDLGQWSALDLLALCADSHELRRAIASALDPSPARQGLLAETAARAVVGEMGNEIAAVMGRLGDGRLDPAERSATATDFRALAEVLIDAAKEIDP